jgi:hypothetical protein
MVKAPQVVSKNDPATVAYPNPMAKSNMTPEMQVGAQPYYLNPSPQFYTPQLGYPSSQYPSQQGYAPNPTAYEPYSYPQTQAYPQSEAYPQTQAYPQTEAYPQTQAYPQAPPNNGNNGYSR